MHIINNENKPPTIVNKYNSIYFEKDISERCMIFLVYFYVINAAVCVLVRYYVKNPSNITNKFSQFL